MAIVVYIYATVYHKTNCIIWIRFNSHNQQLQQLQPTDKKSCIVEYGMGVCIGICIKRPPTKNALNISHICVAIQVIQIYTGVSTNL